MVNVKYLVVIINTMLISTWASLVVQLVKNLPAIHETLVQFLGWEDPLEESMAIHASILAWSIPWTEEPGWATVHRVPKCWT